VNVLTPILKSLLGNGSTSTLTTGVYKHSYTLAQSNQHPSLTIAVDDDLQGYVFTN
jgi:hypothetical protein